MYAESRDHRAFKETKVQPDRSDPVVNLVKPVPRGHRVFPV